MAGQGCVLVSWEPRGAFLPFLPGHTTCPASGRRCLLFGWLLPVFFVNSLCSFLPKSVIDSFLKYLSLASFL